MRATYRAERCCCLGCNYSGEPGLCGTWLGCSARHGPARLRNILAPPSHSLCVLRTWRASRRRESDGERSLHHSPRELVWTRLGSPSSPTPSPISFRPASAPARLSAAAAPPAPCTITMHPGLHGHAIAPFHPLTGNHGDAVYIDYWSGRPTLASSFLTKFR